MTRSNASARAAGARFERIACPLCGAERQLLHPKLAGHMCRRCAADLASEAARVVNRMDPLDRFMAKVVESPSGCWHWQGTRQKNGYASFFLDGRTVRAHRWAYEHFVGPITLGMQIDHLCRVRHCVNPSHLEPVTPRENSRRAMRSHCINGHEFTPENTYMPTDGKRYCRECRRRRVRESRGRAA